MISRQTIQEVREKSSLAEIVSETVPLKRAGTSLMGLCPFHSERSPSFSVREDDGYYHCFGCGASGNVISFVMESRGLSFPEAVEYLAGRFGVEIKTDRGTPAQAQGGEWVKEVYEMNKLALAFYRAQLRGAPPQVGRYLEERGITDAAAQHFHIGFAPKDRTPLSQFLQSKGFNQEKQIKAGLARRNSSGEVFDAFRGRLMFPIFIDSRRVAAFGGRIIPPLFDAEFLDRSPKYINSPETAVYEKSKVLYGVPQAMRALREEGEAFIVEGYMDVVGLSQVGIENVLATCGTALTESHLRRLSRLTKKVVLLFDGDAAGRNAAGRAFTTCVNAEIDVWAVFLPSEDDPDSIARRLGQDTAAYLKELPRKPLVECFLEAQARSQACESLADLGAQALDKVARELMRVLSQVTRPIVREKLIEAGAFRLRLKPEMLLDMVKAGSGDKDVQRPADVPAATRTAEPERDRSIPEVSALSRLDQEILSGVMVIKEELVGRVLHDAALCEALDPATIQFVEGMHAGFRRHESEEDRKEAVRELLQRLGPSWVAHWKKSYQLAQDPDIDMRKSFDECVRQVRRIRLQRAIGEIDKRLAGMVSEDEQMLLHQERLRVLRRVKEMA